MVSAQSDEIKALLEALDNVDPKALAKALETVTAEPKPKTPQLGEPVQSSNGTQQH